MKSRTTGFRMGRVRQTGLSLIELMIAITLGVFLILGMVEVFGTTRAVYQTASGLSRVQENGRFALDFLRRDLRMVGQWGCFNEYTPLRQFINHFSTNLVESTAPWPFRTDLPIEVYDFIGTGPGADVTLDAEPTPENDVASWSPPLPAALGITATALPNSDVLVVRYAEADSVTLAGTNLGGAQVGLLAADAGFVEAGGVYLATDCKSISLFQATSDALPGDLPPGDGVNEAIFNVAIGAGSLNQPRISGGTTEQQAWNELYFGPGAAPTGEGSPLSRYRFAAYYVAPSDNPNGGMSLWRVELDEAPTAAVPLAAPRELIEGVESMQITLGVTDDLTNLEDYQGIGPTNYVSSDDLVGAASANTDAAYIEGLRRAKKIRVSLLLRSPDPGAVATGGQQYQVGDVTVTAPDGDTRVRDVYETLVAFRNRY